MVLNLSQLTKLARAYDSYFGSYPENTFEGLSFLEFVRSVVVDNLPLRKAIQRASFPAKSVLKNWEMALIGRDANGDATEEFQNSHVDWSADAEPVYRGPIPRPPCDVCGAPATNWARDVFRHEPPGDYFVSYSPAPSNKYGCDKHPAQSEEFVTQLPAVRSPDA